MLLLVPLSARPPLFHRAVCQKGSRNLLKCRNL